MQSLADIDGRLAVRLSHIYVAQANYGGLTTGILQAMYLRPPSEDLAAFYRSAELFYSDLIYLEPVLLKQYDEALPELDRALGGPPTTRK